MGHDTADGTLVRWAAHVAARLEPRPPAGSHEAQPPEVRSTPSGAVLVLGQRVVVKVHPARTDASLLGPRVAAAASPATAHVLVAPARARVLAAPRGRAATAWPRVEVLDPAAPVPPRTWTEAATTLARLHRVPVDVGADPAVGALPRHGATDRLARAVARADRLEDPRAADVARAGQRLLEALAHAPGGGLPGGDPARRTVVHGDWHLGQVARSGSGTRLLDVDDLGLGDPAWDLGRPAGFWAAGLLEDTSWEAFLDAYGRGGGPALPERGDPWARLDLPARAAVVVAAAREIDRARAQPTSVSHRDDTDDDALEALCSACRRM